jgi:cell division protein FtsZ
MAKSSFVQSAAKIKVIGMGGGGSNAITRMVRDEIRGVEFIAMNTDAQALAITEAPIRFQLGEKVTRGLGAGGDHNVGMRAAEENRDEIAQLVSGSDMVFLTCGMGGGTGTGSIPVVAEIAKKSGALTIAIVTKPFTFEGRHRSRTAEEGIARLASRCDTLIIIPNDKLLSLCDKQTSIENAFRMADECLRHGVQAISEVITVPGLINLDFADVKAIMKDAGPAWMSIGIGSGPNRAVDAAKSCLASPLLDVSIKGAKGVLFNVTGSNNLTLHEVNQGAEIIKQAVDPGANIIFGVRHDEKMDKEIKITLIATGFAQASSLVDMEDAEVTRLLKSLKVEDELDIPSFMRRPLFNDRRVMPPAHQTTRTETKVN